MAPLSRLLALKELELDGYATDANLGERYDENNLSFISHLTHLIELKIYSTNSVLTEAHVHGWTRLSLLRTLHLVSCTIDDRTRGITDGAMAGIACLSGLRNLTLLDSPVRFQGARHLTALTGLTRLQMVATGAASQCAASQLFSRFQGLELEMKDYEDPDSDEAY